MRREAVRRCCYLSILSIGILLGCLALTACGQTAVRNEGRVEPEWMLVWAPPAGGLKENLPVQAALARGAMLEQNGQIVQGPPPRTTWLVAGTTFGLAVVALDPADTSMVLVHLAASPLTHSWDADISGLPMPIASGCSTGVTPSGSAAFLGQVCGYGVAHTPEYVDAQWVTTQGIVYFADRDPVGVARPSGATLITVDGSSGWLQTQQGISWIVLPSSTGREFTLIAGMTGAAALRATADQVVPNLGRLG
jgi:hypothetical protein